MKISTIIVIFTILAIQIQAKKANQFNYFGDKKFLGVSDGEFSIQTYDECIVNNCPEVCPITEGEDGECSQAYKEFSEKQKATSNKKCQDLQKYIKAHKVTDAFNTKLGLACLEASQPNKYADNQFFNTYMYTCRTGCAQYGLPHTPYKNSQYVTKAEYEDCVLDVCGPIYEEGEGEDIEQGLKDYSALYAKRGQCASAQDVFNNAKKDAQIEFGFEACQKSCELPQKEKGDIAFQKFLNCEVQCMISSGYTLSFSLLLSIVAIILMISI